VIGENVRPVNTSFSPLAEGMESQLQADYLTEQGVNLGQGRLFSVPLRAHEFVAYYRNSKAISGAAQEVIQVA